jgi:hypothetical protein
VGKDGGLTLQFTVILCYFHGETDDEPVDLEGCLFSEKLFRQSHSMEVS